MNVLSLPDEMLASVLKYTRFENLTEFRKVSSKIDSVARRYGLDKWKADSLTIGKYKTATLVWIEGLEYKKRLIRPPSADLLHMLKYYLSKVRTRALCLRIDPKIKNSPISNEVGQFLLETCCKYINSLTICEWDISIKFDVMRKIMTQLKQLCIYMLFTEVEFSEALIEGLSFDCLVLLNKREEPKLMKISLPCLKSMCERRIPFKLYCDLDISTISEVEEFFKQWTTDMVDRIIDWKLTVSIGKKNFDDFIVNISKLKCFEDCIMEQKNYGFTVWFKIVLQKNHIPNYQRQINIIISS